MGRKPNKTITASVFQPTSHDGPINKLSGIRPALYEKDVFGKESKFQVVRFQIARHNDRFQKKLEQSEDIIFECIGSTQLRTGKYIGELVINGDKEKDSVKLIIKSGYSQSLEHRMLNVANHIFVDTSAKYSQDENSPSPLTAILQYLFLSALKRASAAGVPQQYASVRENGLSVRGRIDTQRYLTHDVFNKPNVTYQYREREPVTEIVDVLYYALSLCDKDYLHEEYRELLSFKSSIKSDYSGAVPTSAIIRKAKSAAILTSQMYAPYQNALSYAEMLIRKELSSPIARNEKQSVSGWLIDVTELWETYLAELLRLNFPDWEVDAQADEKIYDDAFFKRSWFPDIVMRKGNDIVILDAKFKKMGFNNADVDRADLHQIHSYCAYYSTKRYHVVLAGLVYPTRDKPVCKLVFPLLGTIQTQTSASYT